MPLPTRPRHPQHRPGRIRRWGAITLALAALGLLVQQVGRPSETPAEDASARRVSGVVTTEIAPPPPVPVVAVAAPLTAPTPTDFAVPVNARHVVVIDDSQGKLLMAKDADTVVPIASLTKLVTAMVVLDAGQNMQEELRITSEDVDRVKHSRSQLAVGARLSRAAALELALIASENRAASALARAYPGGMAGFAQAAQAKLQSLGLRHSHVVEPTGLSPENVSTAAEMAQIVVAAARYRDIRRISSDKASQVLVNGRPREVRNTNRLVGGKGWDIRLSKTGYTEEAGRCLTMRLRDGGRDITVVLLDADGSAQRLRDASLIRKHLGRLSA